MVFCRKKLFGLGNALYTYSNCFFKTNIAENELKYIAQQENRTVKYTPINEVTQYLRDYNIPVNFHKGIIDCIYYALQEVKGNVEKRPIARYFSNIMYDMTLRKDFIWLEPIKDEKYGIQINKPVRWQVLSKEYYERYGLDNNTVFAFLAPQIEIFTVTYVEECINNVLEEKYNNIVENLKKSELKILSQNLETKEKIFGKFYLERTLNGKNLKIKEDYVLVNNKIFKICWNSQDTKPRPVNDEIAYNIESSLRAIDILNKDQSLDDIEERNENKEYYNVDQELQIINEEFNQKGLSKNLYTLLNNFSKRNLKDNGPDPFWKDYARLILNAILFLILVDKNKISIDEIKEKSKDIEHLRKYCENILHKIDIVKIQNFSELIEGITTIRKNDADKTMSFLLEIIYKSF